MYTYTLTDSWFTDNVYITDVYRSTILKTTAQPLFVGLQIVYINTHTRTHIHITHVLYTCPHVHTLCMYTTIGYITSKYSYTIAHGY
jgi:hypothetical protein